MSYFTQKLEQLQRVDSLINRKSTGGPKSLANRLGVSCRTVRNLLYELHLLGAIVEFDRNKNSYIYLKRIQISITIIDEQNGMEQIKGKGFFTLINIY